MALEVGRESEAGTDIRYWLDGPKIESRWRRDFLHPSRQFVGPHSRPYNGYRVCFPGVKAAGAWR
jgi:hypothetical protein